MLHPVAPRCIVASLLILASLPAAAQGPASRIAGVVRSAAGAPIGGVTVTAVHELTRVARSATTNPDGLYTLSNLAPGSYTLSASLVGFRRASRIGVQVDGSDVTVDFVLEQVALQRVVVTATLREQELSEVPFSIAAPTAGELKARGVETIEDVAANVAGFSVQNLGPGQSQVAIRGASAGQIARDQPGVKEQAGIYLDDAPISLSLFTPDLDLFDLSRIEVLRGPQGTLFGAGSLSGTVRYITNQPEIGQRLAFGEVGTSWIQDGGLGTTARVGSNVPLGDRTAGRFVAYLTRFGGYQDARRPDLRVDEDVNTGMRAGLRAALRIEPSARVSVTPRLVFQDVRMDGWNRTDVFNILGNPYTTTRPAVTLGEREHFIQLPEPFSDEFVLGDLNIRLGVGATATLSSVTSYATRDVLVVRDAGALTSSITGGTIGLPEEIYTLNAPLEDRTDAKVITQELRLDGTMGVTKWLVGGFHSRNKREYGQRLLVSGFEAASEIPTEGLAAPKDVLYYSDLAYDLAQTALFGEATVTLGQRLDLTGGMRYYRFDEDREQIFDGIFGNDGNGDSLVSTPGSTKADGFAPRAIASFRINDRASLNVQASRGFRLGGINDPLNYPLCTQQDSITFSGRDSWKDETAWNYEVGTKMLFMGGRTAVNASVFHMDIENLQAVVTAGSCSSRLVFNVPKAVSQGIELEVTSAPSPVFDVAVSATVNRAELRSTLTSTDDDGNTAVVAGIEKGNRLASVPEVQAAFAATFRQPLRAGAQASVTLSLSHVGSRYTQIEDQRSGFGVLNLNSFGDNTLGGPLTASEFRFDPELPAYTLANVRLGMSRDNWELALFVNNVTDERALLSLDRERGLRARVGYLTNQPRTFGLTLGYSY